MQKPPFVTMDPTRQDTTAVTPIRPRERADLAELERFLRHVQELETEAPLSLRGWLELAEAWRITQALRDCRGNRSAAARALGIGRRTLYAKMDKLGITPTWRV